MAKKATLLKTLTLIFVLCLATCAFTACSSHVHEFNYSVTAPATCTKDGSMFGVCSCGETTSITVPKIAHNFVNGVCSSCGVSEGSNSSDSEEQPCTHSWQEADCLNPKICSKCGAVEGLALDHSWGEWFETEPATCQMEGEKRRNCERCGYYETRMILIIDHNFVEGYCSMCGAYDENYHVHDWQEADCLTPKTCLECGAVEGEALGHNFVDNTCINCGLQATPAEYFNFELLEDGTYSIVAKDRNNMPAEVVIPSSYNGKAVMVIGDYAFAECYSITKLVIPASVTTIKYAPSDFGEAPAIAGCLNLKEIVVDENNEHFKAIDGNLYSKDGKTLIQYAIGKTNATFEIPNCITSIDSYSFFGCFGLTSVGIPDSVTSIGRYAFYYCRRLTSVVIPDSVTSIGDYAFEGCNSLTSIVIPDSVTSIGYYAFSGCSSLTSIVIPDSVTSIGYRAFIYCSSLTSIKYRGSKEEWNAISKEYDWDYNTGSYTITYNYIGE